MVLIIQSSCSGPKPKRTFWTCPGHWVSMRTLFVCQSSLACFLMNAGCIDPDLSCPDTWSLCSVAGIRQRLFGNLQPACALPLPTGMVLKPCALQHFYVWSSETVVFALFCPSWLAQIVGTCISRTAEISAFRHCGAVLFISVVPIFTLPLSTSAFLHSLLPYLSILPSRILAHIPLSSIQSHRSIWCQRVFLHSWIGVGWDEPRLPTKMDGVAKSS